MLTRLTGLTCEIWKDTFAECNKHCGGKYAAIIYIWKYYESHGRDPLTGHWWASSWNDYHCFKCKDGQWSCIPAWGPVDQKVNPGDPTTEFTNDLLDKWPKLCCCKKDPIKK